MRFVASDVAVCNVDLDGLVAICNNKKKTMMTVRLWVPTVSFTDEDESPLLPAVCGNGGTV
jgi:hypothetical protein